MEMGDQSPSSETDVGRDRKLFTSLWRGFRLRCPNCDRGRIFHDYLKVAESCTNCGEDLHYHRADDAPPYFTIFIVGHIIIPLVLVVELAYRPPYLVHAVLWLPLAIVLTLILLPVVKGGIVALQWSLFMHGFGNMESDSITVTKSSSHETSV